MIMGNSLLQRQEAVSLSFVLLGDIKDCFPVLYQCRNGTRQRKLRIVDVRRFCAASVELQYFESALAQITNTFTTEVIPAEIKSINLFTQIIEHIIESGIN